MTSSDQELAGTTGGLLREAVQSFAVSSAATLLPGTLIADRFRIEERIGAGGMGVVYRAHDQRLSRSVAIKLAVAPPTTEVAGRMEREAVAMAQLNHPHVVTIYESGFWQEHRFIAMAYMAGGTARQWRDSRPRTWREVVEFYEQVGRGLAAAHRAGVVHRDFKPENVLLDEEGWPCVGDFGLAYDVVGDPALREISHGSLTITGAVLGTPTYMAPEQFDAEPVDHRCDQFAFCVSLFEALHGQRPFPGDTVEDIRRAIDRGPVGDGGRSGPRRLHRVLARGMAADPQDRYRDMDALLADLRHARRRPHGMWAAAVAVAGVLILVVITSLFLSPADRTSSEVQKQPVGRTPGQGLGQSSRDTPTEPPDPRAGRPAFRPPVQNMAGMPDDDGGSATPAGGSPEPSCIYSLRRAGISRDADRSAADRIARPVACYSFEPDDVDDTSSGKRIDDRCGDRDGVGSATLGLVPGMAGTSLLFSGAEHVAIPNRGAIRESFTIAVWVRLDKVPVHPSNPSIVDLWDHPNGRRSWLLGTFQHRIAANTSSDGTFTESMVLDPRPVQLSEWVFHAVTFDGRVLSFYRNGVAVSADQRSIPGRLFPVDIDIWLGLSRNRTKAAHLVGGLDELAIWDVSLTAEQIAALCGT